jgi:hypothetical protein
MTAESENSSGEALERLERDMANVKNALGLLGARPCSVCGKFYLSSNPGNLFTGCGDPVCYGCFSGWWPDRCQHLSTRDRESIEYKIMRWLLDHHRANVYREFSKLPPRELQDVHVVVACHECKGSGKLEGERCHHCLGNGTIWVVTPKSTP